MRLDDFDSSINVEDQRGGGGLGGPGGKIGCGSLIIALVGALVFGINPMQTLGTLQSMQGSSAPQALPGRPGSLAESCSVNAFSRESCNALASLNKTWSPLFQKAGIEFRAPKLVFYSREGQSGCGEAQSCVGADSDGRLCRGCAGPEAQTGRGHRGGASGRGHVC